MLFGWPSTVPSFGLFGMKGMSGTSTTIVSSFEGLFDLVLSILYFGVKVHTPLEISLTALLNICISFLLLTFVGYSFHLSRKSLRFSSKKKKKKKTSLRCIQYWQCNF